MRVGTGPDPCHRGPALRTAWAKRSFSAALSSGDTDLAESLQGFALGVLHLPSGHELGVSAGPHRGHDHSTGGADPLVPVTGQADHGQEPLQVVQADDHISLN